MNKVRIVSAMYALCRRLAATAREPGHRGLPCHDAAPGLEVGPVLLVLNLVVLADGDRLCRLLE